MPTMAVPRVSEPSKPEPACTMAHPTGRSSTSQTAAAVRGQVTPCHRPRATRPRPTANRIVKTLNITWLTLLRLPARAGREPAPEWSQGRGYLPAESICGARKSGVPDICDKLLRVRGQKGAVATCPNMIGSVRLGTTAPLVTLGGGARLVLFVLFRVPTAAREQCSHAPTAT